MAKDYPRRKKGIRVKHEVIDALKRIEAKINKEETTGFFDLDGYGLLSKGITIIAGVHGMDHESFFLNLVTNLGLGGKNVTLITPFETPTAIITSMIAAMANVNIANLYSGRVSDKEQKRVVLASRKLNECKIRFITGPDFEENFESDYVFVYNPDVDSLKNLRSLSPIAPAVALVSFSDEKIRCRPDKRPRCSDLPYEIQRYASQILFVYRDEFYDPRSVSAGKAEIIVARNNTGELGSAELAYLPNFKAFHNLLKD